MERSPPALFALNTSRALGEAVSRALDLPLGAHEERSFEDGEHKTRPLESVRGRDVYVLQSLFGDAAQSVNDKLLRLLFFVAALRDAAAARVTVAVPYLAYARKDRRSQARDPVTSRYVAQMFEAVGIDCIVTLDVHNLAAYQNAFRCRAEHLEANPLFVAHFAEKLRDDDVVVVAPDAGGIKRAEDFRRRFSAALGRPVGMAFAEKHRSGGEVSGEALIGEVADKVAIVVDDLISAGTTIARTAAACRSRGAVRVVAAASHGVLARAANVTLAQSAIEEIVLTDSIPPGRASEPALVDKLVYIGVGGLFAEAISRMHSGGSLVELNAR
jgi:ribose-phosphate pyrophosphokinase